MQTSKPKHLQIGALGEDFVCKYLVKQGFKIVEKNYWKKWGEIDIVAQKDKRLYFVEVKTVTDRLIFRSATDKYDALQNIHPWKKQRLKRVIETYLSEKGVGEEVDWQIDAIAVHLDEEENLLKIERLEEIIL